MYVYVHGYMYTKSRGQLYLPPCWKSSLSYCLSLFWVLQANQPKSLGEVHVSAARLAVGILALQILATLAFTSRD